MTSKSHSHSLRPNTLGVGAITFFVVSAAGPLVAMAGGVPVSMLVGNGAGIPAMFAAAVGILLAFAAGYTAMAQHVTHSGGFYAFAARGLGSHAAGATAFIALFSYTAFQVALYGLMGAAASELLRTVLQFHAPWWACSYAAMTLVALLGYRAVDLSAKLLSVLVIGEYLVVLILDAAILSNPASEISVQAFTPQVVTSGAPWIGLLFCFAAFIGFEATTLYAEEARDPRRTIPIATYVSLLVIGGFYIFSSWCMVMAVGVEHLLPSLTELNDPTAFLFKLSDLHVGPALTLAMRVLFVTSTFAALLAFHNSLARYIFALGRERLLPESYSVTSAATGAPYVASCVQTVSAVVVLTCFVVAGVDPIIVLFSRISAVGTLGIVTLMAVAAAAVLGFFRNRPGNLWRVRVLPLIALCALACVLALGWYRFDTLAGGDSPGILWLPLLIPGSAVFGLMAVERLRRRDLPAFRAVGGCGGIGTSGGPL